MIFTHSPQAIAARLDLDYDGLIVTGFSGGPDSLSLLHCLRSRGFRLLAAHLDHGLRPESAAEAKRVAGLARDLQVPLISQRADVKGHAQAHGLSTEEAARELRYQFLFALAQEKEAQAVAVAHTADDQTETVLMHLLRGAGMAGLRGMSSRMLPNPWSERIPLLRPLLGVWRREVLDYCAENDLNPLTDPSNLDPQYSRNRIRHQIIPLLEDYNPAVKKALFQSADLISADHELLESLLDKSWAQCLLEQATDYLALDIKRLKEQPLSLQRMLLRRAFYTLRPRARDVGYAAIQQALQLILEDEGDREQRDWLAGLSLLIEGHRLWIADWEATLPLDGPQLPTLDKPLHLEVPGSLKLGGNWRLAVSEHPEAPPAALHNADPYQAWLDAERTGHMLTLRARRPGDRFRPLGMQGSLKLADLMINAKLPPRARAAWPLVCKGKEIVWVPGVRMAEPYKIRALSAAALHLKVEKQRA